MRIIEIYIKNLNSKISININILENKININDKVKNITDEQIETLFRIIRTWDNNYYQDNIIDGEEFKITIMSNNKVDVISGKGSYPENYNEFKKWIGEFND